VTSPESPLLALLPVRLLLASASLAAEHLFGEAIAEAARGAQVSILFSEGGLDLLKPGRCAALPDARVPMSICSRSARLRRVSPESLPSFLAWSSLTSFLSDAGPDARLWAVFA
jgi:hypothetical protein